MTEDPLLKRLQAEFENMTVPAQRNAAVGLCCRAAMLTYRERKEEGDSIAQARIQSAKSFRLVMPPLEGIRNIRDFIACTTHGMLLNLLSRDEVGKLLYAAQVAQRAARVRTDETKNKKRGEKAILNHSQST
jgi:hypothetical protein